ncbi:MAG: TSUP family transporter [Treponema sp.]|nr:TSUP family transporter [Treponema sp.]
MMAYSYGVTLLILCPLIFLAAFIDSIAGGGGLISLPAYLLAGLPIHNAHGTNKFTASMGTAMAAVNYMRSRKVDYPAALAGGLCALGGAWAGTSIALAMSPRLLQLCLVIILPLAGVFILSRRGREEGAPREALSPVKKIIFSALAGLVIGCYDGFFGPGTGMFLTIAFSTLVRLELIRAAGTARVINLSSNLASMLTWLRGGHIIFSLAIPGMICAIAGGYVGSRLAIRVGQKLIRRVLVVVAILLFIRILWDLLATMR